ncbi:tRNA (guanosine(46)-N7)-methyltransferase TrmB [bacterium]|nr:tRNA (guanosine(46)-N7)-methyltransferase TrmB [bacterium]
MSRRKLQKFKELENFANVAQVNQENLKKKLKNFLKNTKTLSLELACGKGEYTLALAKRNKNQTFIGIDSQGERIWRGAKQAQVEKLKNVFFLRIQIENLNKYFLKNSVDQIWITFPDPFPRKGQIKKRLTSPRFLKIYKKILKPQGQIHLKTDDLNLFNYSIETINQFGGEILEELPDLYSQKHNVLLDIQTYYEKMHLKKGKAINYLKFRL